jgi:hypothetical protein
MAIQGLITGLATMLIIWAARYACIKGEYHFRRGARYIFLVMGIAGVIAALLAESLVLSAIFSIFGFVCLWGIHEVVEQEERVSKGWYPRKPEKSKK